MALTIFTNVASLNARRSLQKNNHALNQSFQRLSSGLRINSAGDDAAGLAIADRMQAQVRGLNQAARNANDAISVLRTAEGGLIQSTQILQRLRELAVQAASDTNNTSDRNSLQAEADELLVELDRIKDDTEFNNQVLLDGTYLDRVFQIGHDEGDTLTLSIDDAAGNVLGGIAELTTPNGVNTTQASAASLTINGVDVGASAAADDTLSDSGNAASALSKAAAINRVSGASDVTATVNAATTTGTGAVAVEDGFTFTLNGVSVTVGAVVADDADGTLQDAINAVENQTGVRASLDASNNLVLTADDGRNIVITDSGTNEFATAASIAEGTFSGSLTLTSDATIDLSVGTAGDEAIFGLDFSGGTTGTETVDSARVSEIVLTTQSDASDAITTLDNAIRQVGSTRSELGAHMNRLEMATSVLSTTSENTAAAQSQIQDADFAMETAAFARNQIMQQAAAAMLAQANVSGQIALRLLNG
ncbi:MAG: flagellin [Myxococcales bacterium]|nr:flagellin [Myxococcales bacterium]